MIALEKEREKSLLEHWGWTSSQSVPALRVGTGAPISNSVTKLSLILTMANTKLTKWYFLEIISVHTVLDGHFLITTGLLHIYGILCFFVVFVLFYLCYLFMFACSFYLPVWFD